MKYRVLIALALAAALVGPAQAQNYSATAGSGLTFGAKSSASVLYPYFIGCDATTVTQCWAVDASGRLTVNLAAGSTVAVTQATAASLNATVVGTGTFATQLTGATNNINNIAGTVSLPTGASTSANQTNASQKTQIVDGSGNVIGSTNNGLNTFGAAPTVTYGALVKGTTTAMTGTSSTQVVAAVSSQHLYITSVHCNNSSATATLVALQDGSAGTTLDTIICPAGGGDERNSGGFPLFWTTAGNGLYAADVTTSASVIVQAAGYSSAN